MRVKDIEIRETITIMADTPVDEIARLFTEHRVGGLSVIDCKNQIIDIVKGIHLILKEKGMPFSFFRTPRLCRCPVNSVGLMAPRHIKRAPRLHEDVLAKGEA